MGEKQNAFLFDLNGTVIDDMQFHIQSWYQILNNLGATISLEETKLQCYGKNEELLERVFPGRFTAAQIEKMIIDKETKYQENFRPHLKLIEGLREFLEESFQAKIKMAIVPLINAKFKLLPLQRDELVKWISHF